MSQHIGKFQSAEWGTVHVHRGTYASNGALSIMLQTGRSMPLAILSVNMDHGQEGLQSHELPADHFYAKTWSENAGLAKEAIESGLFEVAANFPPIQSGYVTAPVWRIRKAHA